MDTGDSFAIGDISDLISRDNTGVTEVEIDKIQLDPKQPRKAFTDESIKELADSIEKHGLINPVTVKENPDQSGSYIMGAGERRLKAFTLLGRQTIPCIIRPTFSTVQQVVENIQREDLTIEEIANFVKEMLADGYTNESIADTIGKSKSWVSHYTAFNKMPENLRKAYELGRVTDILVINSLMTLEKKNNGIIDKILNENDVVTRSTISQYKDDIREAAAIKQEENGGPIFTDTDTADKERDDPSIPTYGDSEDEADQTQKPASKRNRATIYVKCRIRTGEVKKGILSNKPTTGPTKVFVELDGVLQEFPIKNVTLDKTLNE